MTLPSFDMSAMLGMLPPAMAASLEAISTVIPELGERVIAGELTPEEAGAELGKAMIPTFRTMVQ